VDARTAEQQQAVAAWAATALKAFNEVETDLATEATLRQREPILAAQVAEGTHALDLEQVRYRVGSRDLRTVTQQQMAVYAARSSLLRVQADQRVQRVNLLLALGGGFGYGPAIP
jgi:outer membrane protein, multidrug efflux system